MKTFFSTTATAFGGRSGTSSLDDGSYYVQMAKPNSGDTGVNPEELFALGYAACFDSAMQMAASQLNLECDYSSTSVKVGIGQIDEGGFRLDVDITANLPGMASDEANNLIEKTHHICPYSNATRGNIDVRLHTNLKESVNHV